MIANKKQLIIRPHLLWEYDLKAIDYSKLSVVVIERVIERGNLSEWKGIVDFYGAAEIEAVAERSTRLDAKHKNFTRIFLQSGFIK